MILHQLIEHLDPTAGVPHPFALFCERVGVHQRFGNLFTDLSGNGEIVYMHENPVKRELVLSADEWIGAVRGSTVQGEQVR
jgi:hypothetical protein